MNAVPWLNSVTLAGNEIWRVLLFFVIILASFVAGRIARHLLQAAASKAENKKPALLPAELRALASAAGFLAFAIGLLLGKDFLLMNERVASLAQSVTDVLFILALAWMAYCQVDVVNEWMVRVTSKTASKMDDMLVPLVRKSLRVTIVVLAILQVATTLSDKPVTSLLAGIGVGSLAIALASQETLKQFFGSLVIFADKPFELGDRIVVDGHDGPVEEVGFRSTRIRTLEGHLVTIPNGELANKTILNIGRRPYIRRLMNLTITYDTPPEKVQRAMEILKELLKDHEGMRPDFPPRVAFNEFNNSSLNILVIFWYHPPNYWDFMKFSEQLNLEILRRFNAEGIEFAFPTQTLYLANGGGAGSGADAPGLPGPQ